MGEGGDVFRFYDIKSLVIRVARDRVQLFARLESQDRDGAG